MKSYVTLSKQPDDRTRVPLHESYSEELVLTFISEYTKEGDLVLDPFAGYGTTLDVADHMKRRSIGTRRLGHAEISITDRYYGHIDTTQAPRSPGSFWEAMHACSKRDGGKLVGNEAS